MTNRNVYLKKLKLNEKYIDEYPIALMLRKPGTLSKAEKNWLKSFVAILELKDIPSKIEKNKLSDAFIRCLQKEIL